MIIYNVTGTNISGVVVQWLDGTQATCALAAGGSIQADGFQVGSNGSWVVDDGMHSYAVTIEGSGLQVVHSSWQPSLVFVDGFWWGMGMSCLSLVLWAIRKGFKTPLD